ncbi:MULTISPECIES: hypothetical protein [unclassified Enterococcus]|uniref:hypothetical protein n=1 Tax=unclassified Enterococcus TaxID=2608891 RepID=UPI001CE0D9C7|nr:MULTISPECIES: hypothetical protein [unclassified Enterococcus]MCA5014409.1 hypothetical protein [Enterococcus sp. S23]MCA5017478.1 hypothetical protein [Enterococcus sp. S22(2020)]
MTANMTKEVITTKNDQPIKEISYQDMHHLNDTIDQINSWKETLSLLNDFFENKGVPLNKKRIIREFHANSYVFAAFYEDFLVRIAALEKQVEVLKAKSKVRA